MSCVVLRVRVALLHLCSFLPRLPLPAGAQAPGPKAVPRPPARPVVLTDQQQKDRINSWTVGLAAGRIEGAPLLLASELARVLDDGDNMRVLPIVTRGPFDNVYDLLYLRGVDAAIVYGDVLDHFKNKPEFANSWRRINYLLSLFPSEVHVFARPEIKSLQDLAGKVVNFNTPGNGGKLLRADHLQAARHRREGDLHPAQASPWRRCARATRSRPPSGCRPSRCRSS